MISIVDKKYKSVKILYESDNYLIVDKPPDFLINSDDRDNLNTLQHALMWKILQNQENSKDLKHGFHFIHRLDFATSGVICLGKNKNASAAAGKLFESRIVDKYYIALVRGNIDDEFITVDVAMGYDQKFTNSSKKMCPEGENCVNPKKALTKILVLERGLYKGDPATKILLKPETGRRHQLRLHCHSLGHNIIGDYTYSDGQDTEPSRMYLHSHRLIIPMENEPIDICSQDPFTEGHCEEWSSKCVVNQINGSGNFNSYHKLKSLNFKNIPIIKNKS